MAATLIYDFDPNNLSSSAGASIASLTDSVGGSLALAQATGGSQPTFATTGQQINGRNTLHSDGSKWMATPAFTNVFPATFVQVSRSTINTATRSGSTYQTLFAWQAGAIYGDNKGLFTRDNTNPLGHRIVPGVHVYIVIANGNNSEFWVDGTLAYRGPLALTSLTRLGFFTDSVASRTFGMNGDFGRMRVHAGAMSSSEVAAEFALLAPTYGVTLDPVASVAFTVATGTLATSGRAYRVHVPLGYSSATPTPLAVFCHGSGGSATNVWNSVPGVGAVHDGFMANGSIVAAFDLSTTFTPTTLQSDLDAMAEFLTLLKSTYNISKTITYGESRGGMCSLLTLLNSSPSQVAGWLGMAAVTDGPNWYATTTTAMNPQARPATDYDGKFLRLFHSPGDTSVTLAANATPVSNLAAGHAAERRIDVTSGDHTASDNYDYLRTYQYVRRVLGLTPGVSVSGPSTGFVGFASSTFTTTRADGEAFDGYQFVTIASTGTIDATAASGSISGDNTSTVAVTPANGAAAFTFTYVPSTSGMKTITFTNGQGWANPPTSTFTAADADSSSSSSTSSLSSASSASSNSSSSSSSYSSASSASSNSSSSYSSMSSVSSPSSASSASSNSSSSSSEPEEEPLPPLHPNEARNSFPTLILNDDDPGVVTKIDEMVYQYSKVRTLRGPVTVEMGSPYANSEIRYTLNGKNPTPTSHRYAGPLVFRQNATGEKTTVKARIYDRRNANVKGKIIRLEFRVLFSR